MPVALVVALAALSHACPPNFRQRYIMEDLTTVSVCEHRRHKTLLKAADPAAYRQPKVICAPATASTPCCVISSFETPASITCYPWRDYEHYCTATIVHEDVYHAFLPFNVTTLNCTRWMALAEG